MGQMIWEVEGYFNRRSGRNDHSLHTSEEDRMIWGFLDNPLAELCREWRSELFSEHGWQRHPDQPDHGEAGGFRVDADGVPYGAYLKPGRSKQDNTPRAANEKICSDLANDLSLPVPPALLYRRRSVSGDEEPHVVVTLYLADERDVWRLKDVIDSQVDAQDLIGPAIAEASGIVAFDTWAGNTDRKNTKNTIFFERSDGSYQAAFIDFSYTLNRRDRWNGGGYTDVSIPRLPQLIVDNLDPTEIGETVEAIEQLSEEDVQDVTVRIPAEYMEDEESDLVFQALIDRCERVRAPLQDEFGF